MLFLSGQSLSNGSNSYYHKPPHHAQERHLEDTMATLNLSIHGPSIKSSYQGVVNGDALSSSSGTFARWALFSVQAPLLNAFQDSAAKESILKVESTGGTQTSLATCMLPASCT